jgi:ribosomal protein S27E
MIRPIRNLKYQVVACLGCQEEKHIYKYSKTKISCDLCFNTLVEPTGGKCKIKGRKVE